MRASAKWRGVVWVGRKESVGAQKAVSNVTAPLCHTMRVKKKGVGVGCHKKRTLEPVNPSGNWVAL